MVESDAEATLVSSRRQSTVDRLVTILEAVATAEGGVGVRSLARGSGIDRSSVSRLLRQLTDLGMTVPASAPGRYAIGPRLFAIAGAVNSRDELRVAARPFLEALAGRFNETAYLAVLERHQVVYRDIVESSQPLRYVIDLGIPSPLHAGAAGRAILAGLDDDAAEEVMRAGRLEALTPATVTDATALRRLRDSDRSRGYSTSVGERVSGGAAVAAAFHDATGSCRGSLVVACPAGRLPPARKKELGDVVRAAAGRLSRRLGHAAPAPGTAPGGRSPEASG